MVEERRRAGWRAYYEATAERPPRRTLLAALEKFADARTGRAAVDLGCGDGRDAIELLRRGWSVLAIDAEPEAIARLLARNDLPPGARLRTLTARFEAASWPPVDLVNASFALPLCSGEDFPGVWRKIRAALLPGARFAGQFFGDRDGWAGRSGVTCHDAAAVRDLFAGLEIELFEEEETDTTTPRGKVKHWHLFHVVAQRAGEPPQRRQ